MVLRLGSSHHRCPRGAVMPQMRVKVDASSADESDSLEAAHAVTQALRSYVAQPTAGDTGAVASPGMCLGVPVYPYTPIPLYPHERFGLTYVWLCCVSCPQIPS